MPHTPDLQTCSTFPPVNAIAAVASASVAALILVASLRANAPDGSSRRRRGAALARARDTGVRGRRHLRRPAAGIGAALAVGATEATWSSAGSLPAARSSSRPGSSTTSTLSPVAKLVAQFGAAAAVLGSGLSVEVIGNDMLATVLGLVWLVGITNAFNLLDNMDGLAASLAAVSCAVFAVDAVDGRGRARPRGRARARRGLRRLPPLQPAARKRAAVFMGDSGSQVIGFGLASPALASSWTTAGATTVAAAPSARARDPDPRHDARHRAANARAEAVTQGGTDHTSHRLVYYGLSEQQAVLGLTLLAALLGATGLAYTALGNPRVTAVGVLVSFVVLVQFASFLGDLEERSRRAEEGPPPALWRALVSNPRRLLEVLVDFAVICASFLGAYLLFVDGRGTEVERAIFLSALPVLLAVGTSLRPVRHLPPGLAVRNGTRPGRHRRRRRPLGADHGRDRREDPVASKRFPLEIFVVDALLCDARRRSRLLLRRVARIHRGRAETRAGAGADRRCRPLGPRPRARARRDRTAA